MGWLTILLVAWGTLAFGAVYPWAYWPLMAMSGITGIVALRQRRARAELRAHKSLFVCLALIALAIALQLVPVPHHLLSRLSPTTDSFLQKFSLPYATAVTLSDTQGTPAAHPISVSPAATTRSLILFVTLSLLLAGLACALRAGGVRRLTYRLCVLGVFVALVAIVQRFTIPDSKIYGFWSPTYSADPFGPYVNKHHFAGWMLMTLSVAVGVMLARISSSMPHVRPEWRARLMWLGTRDASLLLLAAAASAVMMLSLVLSLSLSGITSFVVAISLSAALLWRRLSASGRTMALLFTAVVLSIGIGGVGLSRVAARFAYAPWGDLSGRLAAWIDTLAIVRDFPLTGTGMNTYGLAMVEYQRRPMLRHFMQAHNDYLQIVAEGGLLIAVPVSAGIFFLAREIRRRFSEAADDPTTYWIRVGATTGLAAIALQEIVDFSLQMPGNAALFTVLIAIAIHRPPLRPPASKGLYS